MTLEEKAAICKYCVCNTESEDIHSLGYCDEAGLNIEEVDGCPEWYKKWRRGESQ